MEERHKIQGVKRSESQKEIAKGSFASTHEKAVFNIFPNAQTKTRKKKYKMIDIKPRREETKFENEEMKDKIEVMEYEEKKQQMQSNILGGNNMIDIEPRYFIVREGQNEYKPFAYNAIHIAIAYNIHLKSNNQIEDP